MHPIPRVVSPTKREVIPGQQTAGLRREQAFADEDRWVGLVQAAPGEWSGWHHHGAHDTYFYVLKGRLQLEVEGEDGLEVVESGPGDFVHVPSQGIHRERTAPGDAGEVILVRIGHGPTVVNVDGPTG